jgi:hypothetical protein
VHRILNDSGILDDYVVPYYDVLHIQGREYLAEDITEFARERGGGMIVYHETTLEIC